MLAERMRNNKADCYLLNTGWTGGKFGTGKRCPLKYTRAIVDAIHDGSLAKAEYENFPVYVSVTHPLPLAPLFSFTDLYPPFLVSCSFNLAIPTSIPGVPSEILNPRKAWPSTDAFEAEAGRLAGKFQTAFKKYEDGVSAEVLAAGPSVE